MNYLANAGQILIEFVFGIVVGLIVLRVLLQLVRANFQQSDLPVPVQGQQSDPDAAAPHHSGLAPPRHCRRRAGLVAAAAQARADLRHADRRAVVRRRSR